MDVLLLMPSQDDQNPLFQQPPMEADAEGPQQGPTEESYQIPDEISKETHLGDIETVPIGGPSSVFERIERSEAVDTISDGGEEGNRNPDELSEEALLEEVKNGVLTDGDSKPSSDMEGIEISEEVDLRPSSVSEKIEALTALVGNLKDQIVNLSAEAKSISFPETEVSAIQLLGERYDMLKKKFIEESSERKRLYNEVIELRGNIRVFCRCRPLSPDEVANGDSSVFDLDTTQDTEFQIVSPDSSRKRFKFDHVFGPQDNQETVFAETMPIVTSVLDGFNVCIFAYGQTGTGKTFTMEGTPENRGVNYRTLEELFKISKDRDAVVSYQFYVSMLEVYNEKIRDLLGGSTNQPVKKLEIKQAAEGTHEIPGLVEAQAHSTDEVWELLKAGGQVRSVGSTNANELSSRSHCLVRVTVKGENLLNGQRTRSHLWLVDLAGSERVGRIDVEGERLKESQFINKSLSALGDVISSLASKNSHIPYRNSKLTHLLQSSLGKQVDIILLDGPSSADLGETLSSLTFASRVRGIERGPSRKQSDTMELVKYKQMAEKNQQNEKELKKLQDSFHMLQSKYAEQEQLRKKLQEKIKNLESQKEQERARYQQLKTEAASRELKAPTEKRPPLIPLNHRPPLRRITNILPPFETASMIKSAKANSENALSSVAINVPPPPSRPPMKARRVSVAVSTRSQPAAQTTKRRASVAIDFGGRSSAHPPKRRASVAIDFSGRPTHTSLAFDDHSRMSYSKDPRRRSRLFPPLPESVIVEANTPDSKTNRKFFSPLMQQKVSSWKPMLPTISSLRPRQIVSSPVSLRGLKTAQTLSKFNMGIQKKVFSTPIQQQQQVKVEKRKKSE
ncbi:Kinesin-4 [Acorus gramineus]|uniref:Kinesin-like protein n=1 Tax=Acorus gramineus TaxID=55184 RepID=A0AAV9BLZ7_ACOGR|nr:Kinesin-4 [Acorus gramineus]